MLQGIDNTTRKYTHIRDTAKKILMLEDDSETDEDEDLAHGGSKAEEEQMRLEAKKDVAERRKRDEELRQKHGERRVSLTELDVTEASKFFDQEDLDAYRLAFATYDKDESGFISKEEMIQLLRDIGDAPRDEELDFMMQQFDRNGDGQMGFNELIHVIRITKTKQKKANQDELLSAFRAMDQDGSGELTQAELKEALASMGAKFSDKQVTDMMADADEDGNGTIDYHEFAAIMAN